MQWRSLAVRLDLLDKDRRVALFKTFRAKRTRWAPHTMEVVRLAVIEQMSQTQIVEHLSMHKQTVSRAITSFKRSWEQGND